MLATPESGLRLGPFTLSASHLGSDQSENYRKSPQQHHITRMIGRWGSSCGRSGGMFERSNLLPTGRAFNGCAVYPSIGTLYCGWLSSAPDRILRSFAHPSAAIPLYQIRRGGSRVRGIAREGFAPPLHLRCGIATWRVLAISPSPRADRLTI